MLSEPNGREAMKKPSVSEGHKLFKEGSHVEITFFNIKGTVHL
jgi:hypothetical protein